MANDVLLDRVFSAFAHPIRRGIVERLAAREMTVGEATSDFAVSKPAISRHVRVLEEAGVIVRAVDGRTHRLRLNDEALRDAYDWTAAQRSMWERKFAVLDEVFAERRTARGTR